MATAGEITEYAASIQKARDERKQASEQVKQAIADPKTPRRLRMYLRAKLSEGMTMQDARLSLTPEQRIQYDTLEAEASRKNRVERKGKLPRLTFAQPPRSRDGQVIETKHTTKTGEPLFVVKAGERVDREIYNEGTPTPSAWRLVFVVPWQWRRAGVPVQDPRERRRLSQ